MKKTKSFESKNFQFLSLPITSQSEKDKVGFKYMGLGVLIKPPKSPWQVMQSALDDFEPNFKISRSS